MLEISIGIVAVLVVLAIPRLRSAFLSFLGLAAIIAAGSAVIAVVVWALYQAKPWLTPSEPELAESAAAPERVGPEAADTAEADLTSALASEEAQLLAQRQQALSEEKLRIARLVGRARYILEEDRKFAGHAALNPLPVGVPSSFSRIIAIRIPAWRDDELATRQSESIRIWLQSIGLSADETASVSTAKAWGSLYDMWVAETQTAASARPSARQPVPEPATASAPIAREAEEEPEAAPEAAAEPVSVPSLPPEAAPVPPPVASQAAPRREIVRPSSPRRIDTPRRPSQRRPAPREREIGPFGY